MFVMLVRYSGAGGSRTVCGGGGSWGSAGVLEAGGYAVDGEQEEAFEALAFVVLGVRVAQGGQGAELGVGQGVHVGVGERDGAGEYVPVGQQAVVARHGEDEAPGAVVL